MASGVSVNPECVTAYNDIKLGHKFRYLVYALTDDLKEIRVLKTAPTSSTYDDFIEDMRQAEEKKQCRYGIFDAVYKLKDGQNRTKLVFILWSPEEATTKQKMVYTSSKDALKRALVGVGKEMQATDQAELAWETVLELLLRNEVAG